MRPFLTRLQPYDYDLLMINAKEDNFKEGEFIFREGQISDKIFFITKGTVRVYKVLDFEKEITVFLTADHGNSDQMTDDKGNPHTAHTTSPVPFVAIHPKLKGATLEEGGKELALKDIAPTIIYAMGLNKPISFEGISIFK
ncbi:MAG: cyclic nucleotide-binding domain-containing protein [Bacteriovoracia bacterium]